ncbi:MAG: bifunctional hydroxymethylpyrimidine kinase/phosphomethylpyrimidine kinase [bacterium]
MVKRVLIIAGSDSGGGAGIQADIKTVTMLGGYAATAVTAITAQNTNGVQAIECVTADLIGQQITSVLSDIGADSIKIGMIGSIAAGQAILDALSSFTDIPLILDPVLIATSGDPLNEQGMGDFIRSQLLPQADLITPNIPEAEELTGIQILDRHRQLEAATKLCDLGAKAALVKGGHSTSSTIEDILCSDQGYEIFENPRIDTRNTHGTGCTLASAIATNIAKGEHLSDAIGHAIAYLRAALDTAPVLGNGNGSLNHMVTLGKKKP